MEKAHQQKQAFLGNPGFPSETLCLASNPSFFKGPVGQGIYIYIHVVPSCSLIQQIPLILRCVSHPTPHHCQSVGPLRGIVGSDPI